MLDDYVFLRLNVNGISQEGLQERVRGAGSNNAIRLLVDLMPHQSTCFLRLLFLEQHYELLDTFSRKCPP